MASLLIPTRRSRRRSSSPSPPARSARKASPAGSAIIGLPNDPIGRCVSAVRRCPANGIALIPRPEFKLSLGLPMADHNEVAYTTADGNDYEAHEQTYEGFIALVKYGTGAVIIILALMAFFLT